MSTDTRTVAKKIELADGKLVIDGETFGYHIAEHPTVEKLGAGISQVTVSIYADEVHVSEPGIEVQL